MQPLAPARKAPKRPASRQASSGTGAARNTTRPPEPSATHVPKARKERGGVQSPHAGLAVTVAAPTDPTRRGAAAHNQAGISCAIASSCRESCGTPAAIRFGLPKTASQSVESGCRGQTRRLRSLSQDQRGVSALKPGPLVLDGTSQSARPCSRCRCSSSSSHQQQHQCGSPACSSAAWRWLHCRRGERERRACTGAVRAAPPAATAAACAPPPPPSHRPGLSCCRALAQGNPSAAIVNGFNAPANRRVAGPARACCRRRTLSAAACCARHPTAAAPACRICTCRYPYAAPLYINEGSGTSYFCMSTLIHPRLVLTAAHVRAPAQEAGAAAPAALRAVGGSLPSRQPSWQRYPCPYSWPQCVKNDNTGVSERDAIYRPQVRCTCWGASRRHARAAPPHACVRCSRPPARPFAPGRYGWARTSAPLAPATTCALSSPRCRTRASCTSSGTQTPCSSSTLRSCCWTSPAARTRRRCRPSRVRVRGGLGV